MAAARAPLVWTGRMAVGVAGGLFRRSSGTWLLGGASWVSVGSIWVDGDAVC